MKQLLLLSLFLGLVAHTPGQNDHAPTSCHADAALWNNEPVKMDNYHDGSPLSFKELAGRFEQLRKCSIVETQEWMDHGGAAGHTQQQSEEIDAENQRYTLLMARYSNMMNNRMISYLQRHHELEQFQAEDADGMR